MVGQRLLLTGIYRMSAPAFNFLLEGGDPGLFATLQSWGCPVLTWVGVGAGMHTHADSAEPMLARSPWRSTTAWTAC